eukprot:5490927-Prymnesium_polylepis.1
MNGSVRLAESKSMKSRYSALASSPVPVHALRMPKEKAQIATRSTRTTHDLSARLVWIDECISASASSIIVLRQSESAIRYGLIAKKATIWIATSTSASEPGFEPQKVARNMSIANTVKPTTAINCKGCRPVRVRVRVRVCGRGRGPGSGRRHLRVGDHLRVDEEPEVLVAHRVLVPLARRDGVQHELAAVRLVVHRHLGAVDGRDRDRRVGERRQLGHVVVGYEQHVVRRAHLLEPLDDERHEVVRHARERLVEADQQARRAGNPLAHLRAPSGSRAVGAGRIA